MRCRVTDLDVLVEHGLVEEVLDAEGVMVEGDGAIVGKTEGAIYRVTDAGREYQKKLRVVGR